MASWLQTHPRLHVLLLALTALCLLALLGGRALFLSLLEVRLGAYLASEHRLLLQQGEFSGSLVADLRLRGLRLVGADGGAGLKELTLDSLRLDYSLLDLLRGREAFLASSRITLRGGAALVDLSGRSGAGSDGDFPLLSLPRSLPRLAGEELSLTLVHGEHRLELAQASLAVGEEVFGQGQPLTVASEELVLTAQGEKRPVHAGRLSFWYRQDALRLRSLVVDGEEIAASGEFLFPRQAAPGRFAFTVGLWGGELDGEGVLAPRQQEFSCRVRLLDLERLASLFPAAGQALQGELSADLAASRKGSVLAASLSLSGQGAWQGRDLGATLAGSLAGQRFVVDSALLVSGKNRLTINQARLDLPMAGQSLLKLPLAGSLAFSLPDLGELAALLGENDLAGSLRGDVTLGGSLAAPQGTVEARGEKLRLRGLALDTLRLTAQADGERFSLRSLRAGNGDDLLVASGSWLRAEGRIEGLAGELRIAELGRYAPILAPFGLDARGTLAVEVRSPRPQEQEARLLLRQAELGGFAISRADLRLGMAGRELRLAEAVIDTPHGRLSLAGEAMVDRPGEKFSAGLRQLALRVAGEDFVAADPWSLAFSWGGRKSIEIAGLRLVGGGGSIEVRGRLDETAQSRLRVEAANLDGGRWLAAGLGPGYALRGLDCTLLLGGKPAAPRGTLRARAGTLSCPQFAEPLRGTLGLAFGPEGIRIEELDFRSDHGHRLRLTGALPYAPWTGKGVLPGPLALQGLIQLPALGGMGLAPAGEREVTGELLAELDLAGTWQRPAGRVRLKARELVVPQLAGLLPPEPFDLDARLALEGTRLRLVECLFASPASRGELSGEWRDLPALAGLFRQPPAELPGLLDLRGTVALKDLGWLFAESRALRRASGGLSASFSLSGKASSPSVSGTLALAAGSLRFADPALPAVDGLRAEADFQDGAIRLRSLGGLLGGGPFSGEGIILLAGEETRFDCVARGKNLLFYRDADLRVRGDADLRLSGPLHSLLLAGRLDVTAGRYTKKIDFLRLLKGTARPRGAGGLQLFSLSAPPLRDMRFAIEIGAAAPFPVRNNLASGSVRPAFSLLGTGEAPALSGRIFVDPFRISLPSGRLLIESGVITFPEHDPDRPTFELMAKSRLAGYDISMQLQGTAEEPVITLSSQPQLPDEDLLMLVLTGQPPLGQGGRSTAGMNLAVYLGKGLLASWFGNGGVEGDESLLDRLDLEVGRQISGSGQETLEAQLRLAEGLLLPGDRLFITSERDVYDNYNVGLKIVFRFK